MGFTERMLASVIARRTTKVAAVVCTLIAGALLAVLATASGYQRWAPATPCDDMFPGPAAGLCMEPTAPPWLLLLGAGAGGLVAVWLIRSTQRLLRSVSREG
jgi:hypothetical protein